MPPHSCTSYAHLNTTQPPWMDTGVQITGARIPSFGAVLVQGDQV